MSKWLKNFSPLGRRLVAATIAFSTCVALLATALQLYFDYRTELQDIESTFQQVETSYLPTVANALWSTNRHELQVAINGLVRLPDVRQVLVKENGKVWAQAGHPQARNIESREYPLTFVHRGEALTIGTMTMVVDMESVYRRLVNKFWVILITNTTKTFLVAGFMLWLFHVLITRHLHRIAAFASRLNVDNLQEHLELARHVSPHAQPDEFDAVLQGFSSMQSTLASSMSALRESEARFRVMFEQAAVGVAQIQSDTGKLLRVNQKFCDILGYSSAELIQLPVHTITYNEDIQCEQERLNALKNGEINEYTLEQRYCRKDGSLVWVSLTVAPMWLSSGNLRYHVAVVQDITARKQAEAELQQFSNSLERRVEERTAQLVALNQESEAFSYSVSHDLRAPLRSIDGFCQVLAEDYSKQLDETGKMHLSRVRKAAQRMGDLIDDLLQLSLIARAEIIRKHIDLTKLAEEITREIHLPAEAHSIAFTIQPALTAYGDASLLRIMLENLLGNAVKYTRNASQPLIELGSMLLEGRKVFFVRDNGVGFDMAYVGKLFKAFERLHRSDDYPGTGVGLATVKRIVNRHGGDVWAEGRLGKGAVFYFTLEAPARSDSEKLRRVI